MKKTDNLLPSSRPPYSFIASTEGMTRRSFLVTCSLAMAAAWSTRVLGISLESPTLPAYPFQLGVASGDPAPDGFVIWTRLAPLPLEGGGMPNEPVTVYWQVAEDEKMSKVVRKGKFIATPEWAHSVHVEVEGLQPDRWYWYQFKVGQEISQIGRAPQLFRRTTSICHCGHPHYRMAMTCSSTVI